MAKVNSIIGLQGTVGNVTFYRTKYGLFAREKSQLDGKTIATDPRFQRTRENMKEFSRAAKACKLLRAAFLPVLQKVNDNECATRLMKAMMKVIKADTNSVRGERNVLDGNLGLIKGFEFNIKSGLDARFFPKCVASINRAKGQFKIDIPAFEPGSTLAVPKKATHFNLFSAGASLDFNKEKYEVDIKTSDAISINDLRTAPLHLSHTIEPGSTHPLFLVLGIEFLRESHGVKNTLSNGTLNAMTIVKVSTV